MSPANWNPALGGPYWLAQWLVPGWRDFSLPARRCRRIAIRGLARRLVGGPHAVWSDLSLWSRLSATLAGLSCVTLVATWLWETSFRDWASSLRPDGTFGPIDVEGAWADLQGGVAHGLILFTVAWGCCSALAGGFSLIKRRNESPRVGGASHESGAGAAPRVVPSRVWRWRLAIGIAIASLVDLGLAQHDLIVTTEAHRWTDRSPLAEAMPKSPGAESTGGSLVNEPPLLMPRAYRAQWDGWTPETWWTTSSTERLSHVISWDRATWFPKHHRFDGVRLIEAPGSSQDAVMWMLLRVARHRGWQRGDGQWEPDTRLLSALGAEWIVTPDWDRSLWLEQDPALVPIEPSTDWPQSVAMFRNPRAFPEAWIVHAAKAHPRPERHHDLDDLWRWLEPGLFDEEAGFAQWARTRFVGCLAREPSRHACEPKTGIRRGGRCGIHRELGVEPTEAIEGESSRGIEADPADDRLTWLEFPSTHRAGGRCHGARLVSAGSRLRSALASLGANGRKRVGTARIAASFRDAAPSRSVPATSA
ncbi:MAG: hypothetical protein R3B96_05040 [Pirellulaceae bacterium]